MTPRQRTGAEGPETNGDAEDQGLERLARLQEEQDRASADQGHAELDQTSSDTDQTSADRDDALADRDQRAADRDQALADRDQELADRELARHPSPDEEQHHASALAQRERGRANRDTTRRGRVLAAEDRFHTAARRDQAARARDETAARRDDAAQHRDRELELLEERLVPGEAPTRAILDGAAEIRQRAAEDRAQAAEDRVRAAADRSWAAEERGKALEELKRAHRDELTGAYRRAFGLEFLQDEIERARRGDGKLAIAFVDVDGLHGTNKRKGHLAGDALLKRVVTAMRASLRSYDPVVRFGGDEFVCAISGADQAEAEARFDSIRSDLAADEDSATITVGIAELQAQDSLADLIDRADATMRRPAGDRRGDTPTSI